MKTPLLDAGARRLRALTRRHFCFGSGLSLGALALSSLAAAEGAVPPVKRPVAPGRARRVLYLFMAGGPSQIDLFDPKPRLDALDGQPLPPSLAGGERFPFIKGPPRLLRSPFRFARAGGAGHPLSELLPHLARNADRLAVIRSMHTTQVNHGPAQVFMNSGHQIVGRPSLGAWLSYGLGAQNRDLPTFAVLLSGERHPEGGKSLWSNAFLPAAHQGVELRGAGDPVLFLSNPRGVDRQARRDSLDTLAALERHRRREIGARALADRLARYELAFRMQTAVPELADIASEPAAMHARYGTTPGRRSYANNCLLARRLLERGCRFVQLYHRGWDTHGVNRSDDLLHRLPALCRETDRATAALLADLGERGLLEDTVVIWGGEFGRTPMVEGRDGSRFLGRDHHRRAFTVWLAGAGIRPGAVVGATDELGFQVTADPVSVHDLHATVLHLLGLDHTALTFRVLGRDFRLTDVAGQVVQPLVA